MDVLVALETVDLLEQPADDARISDTMPKGRSARELSQNPDRTWLHVRYPPTGALKAQGWARTEHFQVQQAEIELPSIVVADFVRRAFSAAGEFHILPEHHQHPAVSDFMLALSIIVSDMKNVQIGSRIGPFQYEEKAWKELTKIDSPPRGFLPKDSSIDDWYWQIAAAAVEMHVNGKALAAAHAESGEGSSATDPFIPDYHALLHAHLLGAKAAFALWQARKANAAGGDLAELVKTARGIDADAVKAIFAERPKLYLTGGDAAGAPLSVADFNTQSGTLLNAAFKKARELLLEHVPEIAPAGTATWMEEARKWEEKKLDEQSDNETIKSFFAATNFGPVGAGKAPAWCGAFAAHCLKAAGGAAAASIPKGAATAANWKGWGDRSLGVGADSTHIPKGAVVVLSPGDDSGSSGHVGFYVERGGGKITLLGGNQGNTVKESRYALSRVVDIRWLGALSATAGKVSAGKLPEGARPDMAELIIRKFAEAGFKKHQQIAALANAIRESNLDPTAHNTKNEDSVGLFQCNRDGGLGTGHSVADLMNPEYNIDVILKAARGSAGFRVAEDINEAVRAFVVDVERPADREGEIKKRREIAKTLV